MICTVALNLGREEKNNLKVESGMKQVGEKKKAPISSITFLLPLIIFFLKKAKNNF